VRVRGLLGGRAVRAALGILVSVVAIALVARSVDLPAAGDALRAADGRWIGLLLACIACDLALRAVRMRVLLAPVAIIPLRSTLASLLVGYLANNVLPARLGELVRSADLGRRAGVSGSTVLGTIVVERVIDTLVVVGIAALAILVLSVRGIVASAILVGVAIAALLGVGVAVGVYAHRLPGAARIGGWLGRWPRARDLLRRLRTGLSVAGDARAMARAVALSLGSWSFAVVGFAAAAQAVGVPPTMGQATLLAAGVNLATAIPAGPGYVGTFELAAVTIAASVGIAAEPALAMAIVVHATALGVTSAGGAIALVLRPRARDAMSTPGA
jgi:hypothetical protein